MSEKCKCLHCGSENLYIQELDHMVFCYECGLVTPESEYDFVVPPAPRPPCKWYYPMIGSDCRNPSSWKQCPGNDKCGFYEPQVAEKPVMMLNLTEQHKEHIRVFSEKLRAGGLFMPVFKDEMMQYKEDNDMSGNAYFCDSCRGTFPQEGVLKVAMCFTHFSRVGEKTAQDTAEHGYICTACNQKFRKAVEDFNFPWDEWRKSDDDDNE